MVSTSKLDVNAPPFYPSVNWYPKITEEYYKHRPHSPGKKGFVIADAFEPAFVVSDEELFDTTYHPVTPEEMQELAEVDEINEILAELDLMETQHELHFKLSEKTRELRSSSEVEAEIRSLLAKSAKMGNDVAAKHQQRALKQKTSFHSKKNAFAHVQQPRAQK